MKKRNNVGAIKAFKRIRIVLSFAAFAAALILSFAILVSFIHYPLWLLGGLSLLAVLGYLFNNYLYNYTKKELEVLNRIIPSIKYPSSITKIREFGLELFFPLVLFAIGVDPIKDIIELKSPQFSFNYLFFDLALFILILAHIPTFIWVFYVGLKDELKKLKSR